MQQSPDTRYDVASAISQGRRPYQEDALVTDFPMGAGMGFAVLADGMGGHAAGDVASKIVVTEVFSEIKLQSGDRAAFEAQVPSILRNAALAANECVLGHMESNIETEGMGATLLAPVFLSERLYWISVGDSPLFLFRRSELIQLNEDHSMAPQIDFMIRSGMMDEEAGRNHPDRSALTSVLGGDMVPRIDCPSEPVVLEDGDILVVASDGIQYLSEDEIAALLAQHREAPSVDIAGALLEKLEGHGDPEQDNASFTIIKIERRAARKAAASKGRREKRAPEPAAQRDDLVAANTAPRTKGGLFSRGSAFLRGMSS